MLLDTSDESVSVTWCEKMSLCCIGAFPLSAQDDPDPKLLDWRKFCAAVADIGPAQGPQYHIMLCTGGKTNQQDLHVHLDIVPETTAHICGAS